MIWDEEKMVGLDFETSGSDPKFALQPWRVAQGTAWITDAAILRKVGKSYERFDPGLNEGGYSHVPAPQRHKVIRRALAAFLERSIDEGWTIVGWNLAFDIQWLLALGLEDLVFKCKWLDGMLLWRHYFIEPEYEMTRNQKKSYGLKECVAELMPQHAGYNEDVDFHDETPEARATLDAYNIRDTKFSMVCARHFFNLLEPQQLRAALIEAASLPMIAKANLDGMLVDTLACRELQQYLVDTAEKQLAKLAEFGVTEKIVRSPTQLAVLMYDEWKLPVLKENKGKKTGKITRATDKEVLHELAFADPRAKDLRLYREALNNKTKFADAPIISADYNGDGYTRPYAFVFGTYSGRLTYGSKQGKGVAAVPTGFALHQEKRGALFRGVVVAPPGYTLVEFDASGQEFRWMAIASGDETMLKLCAPGEDPHSFMGSRITGIIYQQLMIRSKDKDDEEAVGGRQLGKVANLSLQYRTSARKLRSVARVDYLIPLELPQAQMIHKTYQQTYPGVPDYWKEQIADTKARGYVETFAGRRVVVAGNWGGNFGWSMGSTAINYRIQGTGADQKYLALSVIKPYLTSIGAYFAWDLHDGIYMWVPDDKVQTAVRDIRHLLNNLPYARAWGFTPPIALPWDCKVGKSWGSLKEYHDA